MQVVLEGILFVLCEGCSWRAIDRPQARWNSVYQYFRRWCQRGTLQQVLTQYGPELAPGWHFLDSTHVKVHADGSNPAGGQVSQAMGRTKGGLNTKSTPSSMLVPKPSCWLCPPVTKPTFL
jgi:transposase